MRGIISMMGGRRVVGGWGERGELLLFVWVVVCDGWGLTCCRSDVGAGAVRTMSIGRKAP